MSIRKIESQSRLAVRNIGGIEETEVAFDPGVTVLSGRNATNRTSLLQAITAALGSDNVSIKADADEADVELTFDGKAYTRRFQHRDGTVRAGGDPYLEDSTVADLFAFLLESNEARRAVVTDGDLRELIMRPVDTDDIQAEIDRLLEKRREIDDELEELEELKNRLPSLEKERTRLEDELEETRAELEALESEIDAANADVEQSRQDKSELEARLETLREKRSDLEDVRYELDTEAESLESLRAEKRDLEAEYEELPDAPAGELEAFEARIDRLRTQKQELESELNELQSVIGFNQDMLDDAEDGVFAALQEDDGSETVTDDLLVDETVTCWTCGSEVDSDQIERTVERLRELSKETVGEINTVADELDELNARCRERENQQRQRDRLERRRRELDEEIETTEERIETFSERRDALHEEVKAVEAEVETLEDDTHEEILDLHKEANQLEYDLGTIESDLERVEDNIETIETRLDEEADLQARYEAINDEIETLRTKIERIETQAIEGFNEHMDTVLELLEYDNLARIWLEQTERAVREGRQTVTKSAFELHVVRQTDSGATYEDTVENLSESEREVTGLLFALAGYLAHEVYETVPFMLLDSLEAIDSSRIAVLVDYLAEYSEHLVVAALPEDAAALSDSYRRITDI